MAIIFSLNSLNLLHGTNGHNYLKKNSGHPGLGSIHFFQFNSIPIQVGFKIFQFNSILIQIGFRIFQFNSNSIHFLSIPIQFNSNFMHCNKQISQIIGYFKFNLNISLFAAQSRKYIIQDHNHSRINKSALVQVLG